MKALKSILFMLVISTISLSGCGEIVNTTTPSTTPSPLVGTWVYNASATVKYKKIFNADGTYISSVNNNNTGYVQNDTGTYSYINMPGLVKSLVCFSSDGSTTTLVGVGVSSSTLVIGLYCITEPSDLIGTWNGIISKTGTGAYNISDGAIITDNSIFLSHSVAVSSPSNYTVSAGLSDLNISAGTVTVSGSNDTVNLPNGSYHFAMADGVMSRLSLNPAYLNGVYIKQ